MTKEERAAYAKAYYEANKEKAAAYAKASRAKKKFEALVAIFEKRARKTRTLSKIPHVKLLRDILHGEDNVQG